MQAVRSALVLSVICAAAALAAQPRIMRLDGSVVSPADIDATVTRLMKSADVPGLALAILNERKIVYLKAYGVRDVDESLPLTTDSVMSAASLTKPTFAYLVMQLLEEGRIALDTPVGTYLRRPLADYPEYTDLAGDVRADQITARMLLSHTAGFPNLRILNKGILNINFTPGTRYAYSGEGIQLLQLVVEEVMRQPLRDLMHERVFRPLRMTRTSMVWEPAFESDFANGYDQDGRSRGQQRRTRADAAGSMQTTIHDFSRFVEHVAGRSGLKNSTHALMFSPQIAITSRTQFPTLSTETTDANRHIRLSYGLGWGLFWSPVGKAFFKEGHDTGWQHYAVVFDAARIGMVMMTNSSNGESIFQELSDALNRNTYSPFEWEGYVPYWKREKRPALKPREALAVSPALLNDYIGRYQAPGLPIMSVARDDEQLTVVEDGDTELIALIPQGADVFYAPKTDAEITFERSADGRVVAMIARVRGVVLTARRLP